MRDDGGAAFPTSTRHTRQGGVDGVATEWVAHHLGMTLRDYFAGQEMLNHRVANRGLVGWIINKINPGYSLEQAAEECYDMADAMLAERNRAPETQP